MVGGVSGVLIMASRFRDASLSHSCKKFEALSGDDNCVVRISSCLSPAGMELLSCQPRPLCSRDNGCDPHAR